MLAAAAAVAAAQDASASRSFRGRIEGEVRWSGRIRIDGDVEVAAGARLVVEPGAEVVVAAADAASAGWNPKLVEIHVKGLLLVEGTAAAPARFRPERAAPKPERFSDWQTRAWHGIALWPESGPGHRVHHAVFEGAFAALQLPAGGLQVEECVFLGCSMGIEAGVAHADSERLGIDVGAAHVEARRCRFSRGCAGVCLDAWGTATLADCVFDHCVAGAGGMAPAVRRAPEEPGTVADRCTFWRNECGVVGAAVVTNSVFAGNECAASPTNQHAVYDAEEDHFLYAHCLFHENPVLVRGEAVLGPGNVHAPPSWTGPMSALEEAWPPVPEAVKLAPASPGAGRASDGGDVGALGRRGTGPGRTRAGWSPAGRVLAVLALRPIADPKAPAGASPKDAVLKSPPAPGARAAGSWWAAPPEAEEGIADLAAAFGANAIGWIAALVECAGACDAEVEVNGDLAGVEVWWNGKPVEAPRTPRRFQGAGAVLKLKAAAGRNALVLQVASRRGESRLGIACRTAPEKSLRAAEPRPEPAALRAGSARRIVEGGRSWLEIASPVALNWTDAGRAGLLRFTGADGGAVPGLDVLSFEFRSPQLLRAGPLPDGLPDALLLRLEGFRDPWGAVLPADAKPCRVTGLR